MKQGYDQREWCGRVSDGAQRYQGKGENHEIGDGRQNLQLTPRVVEGGEETRERIWIYTRYTSRREDLMSKIEISFYRV